MSFLTAYTHTKKFEAGYANLKTDPGGETFRGISRVSWPNWDGWPIVDSIKLDIQNAKGTVNWHKTATWPLIDKEAQKKPALDRLTQDHYERFFYNPIKAWGLAEEATDKLFDLNVNLSPKSAAKVFQRAVNSLGGERITVDGVVGEKTLTRARALAPGALVAAIAKYQEAFYRGVTIQKYPNAEKAFLARARWIPRPTDV